MHSHGAVVVSIFYFELELGTSAKVGTRPVQCKSPPIDPLHAVSCEKRLIEKTTVIRLSLHTPS